MKSSITGALAAAVLGIVLAAMPAVAENVNVEFKNPAQLTGYRTYTVKNLYTTDAMVEPRLAIAIDRNLQVKGWHEVANGQVLVTAVLASKNDSQQYQHFYESLTNLAWNSVSIDPPGQAPTSVKAAPAGTLIIDMYDTRTGKLVWRSTAADFLTSNTGKNELRVDTAVDKMFRSLPWDDAPESYNHWINNN